MAQPGKQPKAMSSRLLTMKFMQRASASPSSAPSTPSEPPSKKQRMSNGSYSSASPSTPRTDAQAVQEALASAERKRSEALEREAADRGETKWYLSVKQPQTPAHESPVRIVSAGYSTLDSTGTARERSSDEGETEPARPSIAGRRSFGNFRQTVKKQRNPDASSSASESDASRSGDEDENEDESDDPTGAKAFIAQSRKEASEKVRAERKAKKHTDQAEALRLADERRHKQVNLNNMTSISNPRSGGKDRGGAQHMICHQCGQKGHLKNECPQRARPNTDRRNRER
ncbi:hypothetical protein B0A55_03554 [Friedmanniomyces simplex]|uniref:CCHC-type domain-containing protein n=1 Tax=Friedmanniomyces simplex TaxID=329884 RepID=A0A4U0XY55_9PEZI|nr:hypothetical protein B0A55_03554 [Friedmanniomyces simplex]